MFRLEQVTIEFESKRLFDEISCTFAAGSIYSLRKAGVLDGSSTLLKVCAGLLPPSKGSILFQGNDIADWSDTERYRRLCYCHEHGGLVSLFSVFNNIAFPAIYHELYATTELTGRIIDSAQRLRIESLLHLEPFQLNDVQKRLVNLARAITIDASVILLDEFQSGMSFSMLQQVVEVLHSLAEDGKTILMVTTSGDDDSFAHHHFHIHQRKLEALS